MPDTPHMLPGEPGNQHFEMDGVPVRVQSPAHIPELVRDGKWEPFHNTWKFLHDADPIEKADFDKLVTHHGGVAPDESPV